MSERMQRLNWLKTKQGLVVSASASILMLAWAILDRTTEPWFAFLATLPPLLYSVFARDSLKEYHSLKANLSFANDLLDQLKPQSALSSLERFSSLLKSSKLSNEHEEEVLGKYYYLKGSCLLLIGENDQLGFEYLIKAHLKNKSNKAFKEKAIRAYVHLQEFSHASTLVEEILAEDPYNSVAWATKAQLSSQDGQLPIPSIVSDKLEFKFIYTSFLLNSGKLSQARKVNKDHLDFLNPDLDITSNNFRYFVQLAMFQYTLLLSERPLHLNPDKNQSPKNDKEMEHLNMALKKLHIFFHDTELYQNPFYLQVLLALNYTEFLLSGDKEGILKNYEILKRGFKYETEKLAIQTVICLAQSSEFEKAITLADSRRSSFHLQIIKADCELKDKRTQEALQTFEKALGLLVTISQEIMPVCFMIVDIFYQSKADTTKLFNEYIAQKRFEKPYQKNLLNAYSHRFAQELPNDVLDSLLEIIELPQELTREERMACASILFTIQCFKECQALLEPFINLEIESPELLLYIEAICNQKEDHHKVLAHLARWNDRHSINEMMLANEIDIQQALGNFRRIEDLATIGTKHYQQNPYFFLNLVLSLYRNEKYTEVIKLLPSSKNYLFTPYQLFQIAQVCFWVDETQLGCDLAYQGVTKDSENVVVREQYFSLMTTGCNEEKLPQPTVVKNNTVVRVSTEEGERLLKVNDQTIATNHMVPHFLGKQVGDVVDIKEAISSKKRKYQILQIMNKYTGMVAEIAAEVGRGTELSGYSITAIDFPRNDIRAFEQVLQDKFGEDGHIRKILVEDSFDHYYNGSLSFTELVIRVNRDEPLMIYNHLVTHGKWFKVVPLKLLEKVDYSQITEYVIDFTSLPFLCELSKSLSLNAKFIVSSFLVEHLKEKIHELERVSEDQLSVTIFANEVQRHITSKSEIDRKRNQYHEYLKWITNSCSIEYSPQRLDLARKLTDTTRDHWYMTYWIDTVFLANSNRRSLITDDLANYTMSFSLSRPMTTEVFIKRNKGSNTLAAYDLFFKRRYVGVQISANLLIESFAKNSLYERNQHFKNCIQALDFCHHDDKHALFEVLTFLKHLYSLGLNQRFKDSIAELMIHECLRNHPRDLRLGSQITNRVRKDFNLLGNAELHVLKVISKVFAILGFSK